jgi:hypothetical protein
MISNEVLAATKILAIPVVAAIVLGLVFMPFREVAEFLEFRRGQKRGVTIWRENLPQQISSTVIDTHRDYNTVLGYVRETPRGWLARAQISGKVWMPIIGEIQKNRDGILVIEYRAPISAMILNVLLGATVVLAPVVIIVCVAQLWMYRRAILQVLSQL